MDMAGKKRSKEQLLHDRARIAELKLQQYTDAEIRDIIIAEGGVPVSRRQITYDMSRIRHAWLERQHESYHLLVFQELARIDALEREIWQEMRNSARGKEKEVVEKVARKIQDSDEDDYEMVVSKVTQTLEETSISPSYFAQIQECQKERRRLLGLYAPQQIGVQKTVVVKGYKDISPDDWDVVEGEVLN